MSDGRDFRDRPARRPTSLLVVVPALLLFSLALLGAALLFRESVRDGASAGRWIGSTSFLLFSIALVTALMRSIALRFGRPRPGRRDVAPDAASGNRPETKAAELAEAVPGPDDAAADQELSEAVIAVLGYGTHCFPEEDYSGLASRFGEARARDLAFQVGALLKELARVKVNWTAHTLASGGEEARAHMASRHPELTKEALKALEWTFTYSWR